MLEEKFKMVVPETLGCELHEMSRGDNGADAAELYDQKIGRVENLFREAEKLQGQQRL
jgi:hypothetical protein